MSLRNRIALAAAIAVATVAVGLGVIGYFVNRAKLIDQVRTQLQQRATALLTSGTDLGGKGHDGRPDGLGVIGQCGSPGSALIASSQLGGARGSVQLVCPGGQVVAEQDATDQLPVTPQVIRIAQRSQGSVFFTAYVHRLHLEVLAVGDREDGAAIEVAMPLTLVDSTLRALLVTGLILAGAGAILAGLAGLLIGRAAVGPIRRFSERTEHVTSSLDHPRRLEETGAQELKRLAASFNQTLTALELSVEAQRQLVVDASHELRTPIAALRSDIQIFVEAERLPAYERADLQASIIAELDDVTQLVADVLELARGSQSGDYTETLELDGIIRDAVERTQRRAPTIRFEVDLAPTVIVNHPDRVGRAVTNVIDNARKWSPSDGVIEVSLRGGTLVVRDHGPGFNEQDTDHLFDRFFRSADARRMPGSGLGLAIVKQAAEAHGGFAEAHNAPGGGAVVRVSFGGRRLAVG
jgi:two-component system, OmpR family, sensor histidine kinase MprB